MWHHICKRSGMNETSIVRVCAECQRETKAVLPVLPGVAYSHGACRRHGLAMFALIVGNGAAVAFVEAKPACYWCPEMKNPPAS